VLLKNVKELKQGRIDGKSYLPVFHLTAKELPSQFKAYPENVRISYTPFTFGEIKQYSQSAFDLVAKFEWLLEGITVEGMDSRDLTLCDFTYIALLRNLNTFAEKKFTARYGCQHCGKEAEGTEDLRNIEFVDIIAPKFPIIATYSFGDKVYKPLTVGQAIDLFKHELINDLYAILAIQSGIPIEEVKEEAEMLKTLSYSDYAILELVGEYLYHGIKPISLICPHCKEVNLIGIEEDSDVLIAPFRPDPNTNTNGISFGDKGDSKSGTNRKSRLSRGKKIK
jgi:hypothetical protein